METEPLTSRLVGVINRQIQGKNLSVISVAEKTGIPHVTLRRRFTSHGRGLTVDEVVRIAAELGTTPTALVSQAEAAHD
mgnify:CR=1 FL=1